MTRYRRTFSNPGRAFIGFQGTRKVGWLLLVLVPVICVTAGAKPVLEISPASWDFGLVPANQTVVFRPWFKSIGEDTLRITGVKTGCGCLAMPDSLLDLAPGDSVQVTLYWQTRAADGELGSTAYLFSDSGLDPYEISLMAVGSHDVPRVDLGNPRKVRKEFPLVLQNKAEHAVAIEVLSPSSDYFELYLPQSIPAGGSVNGSVRLSESFAGRAGDAKGDFRFEESVTIELRHEERTIRRMTIPVRFGDFSFRPEYTTTETSGTN